MDIQSFSQPTGTLMFPETPEDEMVVYPACQVTPSTLCSPQR